ncbi:unnamed protein product [Miscanthus lutarioriparius]|uniref:Uncharacterized protein n=1 Tax=Miscanthus lutarioriparius TaxID=422564 RepID=A0A811MGW9_9POAL|nr:unnamed protein product [Miscanthus lutarioriparius]
MVKAAVVAVLLMQCCDVILAARPLLHVAAGADGGWQGAVITMVMQVLDKGPPGGAGAPNCDWRNPGNPGCQT